MLEDSSVKKDGVYICQFDVLVLITMWHLKTVAQIYFAHVPSVLVSLYHFRCTPHSAVLGQDGSAAQKQRKKKGKRVPSCVGSKIALAATAAKHLCA